MFISYLTIEELSCVTEEKTNNKCQTMIPTTTKETTVAGAITTTTVAPAICTSTALTTSAPNLTTKSATNSPRIARITINRSTQTNFLLTHHPNNNNDFFESHSMTSNSSSTNSINNIGGGGGTGSANCNKANSSCSDSTTSSDSHADIMSLEQLLLAVQEETDDEGGLSDVIPLPPLAHHHHYHRHTCNHNNNSNSDCEECQNSCCSCSDNETTPASYINNNTNSNNSNSSSSTRRFRRSSVGMQRKSAFRQRKLDSLGNWRHQRRTTSSTGIRRPIRIVPDWTENAIQGEHYWKPSSASGDLCCLNEECIKSGQRMKCSACQLIAHQNCIPMVNEKTQLACKPTYRDVGIRQYREQTVTHHHWVHRKMEKGKCKQCGKAVQGKLFGSKEIVALSCAWCHEVYHNKESCFNQSKIGEECKLGNYAPIIVPPSWIVKLPSKGNFKSSIRVNNKQNASGKKARVASKKGTKKEERKEQRAFIVKPIPSPEVIPVIVYINPKSGGNQGVKLLGKFQHLLNPRQVFDLTQGGPKMGLELFRKTPNLRILACGGDGTVGWVLSVLDQLNPPITPPPAVGVLPLGTGNDLARALGWGGGYTDEPIGKILREIGMSQCVLMDRWRLKVRLNEDVPDDNVERSKPNVPLNVINNYFSFGVDAHIALEFHEAREAHPERFNSRLRNKMYYGQMGGKDLILRQYRNLSQWVTLECDGTDYTQKLKDAGCHAVLFLNIPSYGGGTHPWNDSFGQSKPSIEDGLIEVVGLTTYQLPMLQAGLHGTCICQCRTARIVTTKTIPMQVDGEACRVKPCIIEVDLLNKAVMLAKRKQGRGDVQVNPLERLQLVILRVTMDQYERHHYDKPMLRKLANKLGIVEIDSQCDLEQVRNMLNEKFEQSISYPKVSQDWCFIDSCTAEHFFRIDRAQEHLHYICDIAADELFILDHEAATMPQTPDQERSFSAYSQRQAQERRNMEQGRSGSTEDIQIGKPIKVIKFKSRQDRLFSFNEEVFGYGFSPILEQTSDAVLLAAQSGDLNMLRALHELGYSLQTTNTKGHTALHLACKYNNKDIVKYILSCASRRLINMADKERGSTALHIAAELNRHDICVMLVAAGANIEARDMCGNTPMMVAFNKNANEIATYLESQERFLHMGVQTTN
ncbi:Eye-specific diacylglycerol kinase [Lucilia cuprina]|uniref:Diacylglycerol kinase n=1 Tax=Lucilia cuprina TaxID=7375 RepID=A0A0L0BZA2_LUCCU|nr:Eye-specific diacylglycerol kinase [Lucilia cuprina]KNC25321.1 Eye-specific diacylglycerol kinase [Lucilia cuprina]